MSSTDEKFDGMFMTIAQQSQGIEPLLENLFSFLRRKTDFFAGASSEKIEELVMEVVNKQATIHLKDVENKRIAKEKDDKRKKVLAEKKKKVHTIYIYNPIIIIIIIIIIDLFLLNYISTMYF
jgi:hypothetical protein